MGQLTKLPTWADKTHIHAVVETPRGSKCKIAFDASLKAFTLTKPLMAGLTYPHDWGFVPSTKADDGDPLDVLMIHEASTYPGLVLRCKPIGVLELLQKNSEGKERNDRVIAVPERSPLEGSMNDIRKMPKKALEELENFFKATNALEEKEVEILGWGGPGQAIKTIERLRT